MLTYAWVELLSSYKLLKSTDHDPQQDDDEEEEQ